MRTGVSGWGKSIPVCINHAVGADGNYGYTEGYRNAFGVHTLANMHQMHSADF